MNIEFPWKEPDFIEAWDEWVQYRKERKLPKYVPRGLQKTLTMLKNISGDNKTTAIKIINQSIEQNYQGLFPLRQQNGTIKSGAQERNRQNASDFLATAKANFNTVTGRKQSSGS